MKREIWLALFLCAALLTGCEQTPPQESGSPAPTIFEMVELTPVTPEEAAALYAQFLGDNLPAWRDDIPLYFCEEPQDYSALADGLLTVRDLTGDGIPELCYQGKYLPLTIWTVEEGRVKTLLSGDSGKTLLPNGGLLSDSWNTVRYGHVYTYYWLSPESRELPEIVFFSGDEDQDGEEDWFSINGTKVSQAEWEKRTAPYRALQDQEAKQGVLFQDWAETFSVTVSSASEPTTTPEEAAVLYARFLQDDVTTYAWGKTQYHSYSYYGLNMESALDMYLVEDLTGDGIPELYNNNPGPSNPIWSIKDGRVIMIGRTDTYTKIAPNGGYFYHRPGGAPTHDVYWYEWLSPESKALPEASFSDWHPGNEPDFYHFNGEEVTREEWEVLTAPYFALYEQERDEEESLCFREWAATLGVELPPPEMNEAKALRIFDNELRMPWERDEIEYYNLRVWDFDGDGVPEIYDVIEPFRVYGIVGLHMEELGTLADFGGIPKEAITYSAWKEEINALGEEVP